MKKLVLSAVSLLLSYNTFAADVNTSGATSLKTNITSNVIPIKMPVKMPELSSCDAISPYMNIKSGDACSAFTDSTGKVEKTYLGHGIKNLGEYYNNESDEDQYIYETDERGVDGFNVSYTTIQGNWAQTANSIFRLATMEEGNTQPLRGRSGNIYRVYKPNTSALIVRTNTSEDGIGFKSVTNGMIAGKPGFVITYTTHTYVVRDGKRVGPFTHNHHTILYPAWCGDGIVDTEYGEKYDDGVNNGKLGYASTDCQKKT